MTSSKSMEPVSVYRDPQGFVVICQQPGIEDPQTIRLTRDQIPLLCRWLKEAAAESA